VKRLSKPRTTIPAKKYHLAGEDLLSNRLAKAVVKLKTAAAHGSKEKSVTISLAWQVQPSLPTPQPQ
jgi:hypothetical protein